MKRIKSRFTGLIAVAAMFLSAACASGPEEGAPSRVAGGAEHVHDVHSHSRPDRVRTAHLVLDLELDFAARRLHGRATHDLERVGDQGEDATFIVDVKHLDIVAVTSRGKPLGHRIEKGDEVLGDALIIDVGDGCDQVTIEYLTTAAGSGLQWLDAAQTAGKRHPFLFSQSQAIHARTWIPCQDTPGVRTTFEAAVWAPDGIVPVMSAANRPDLRAGYAREGRLPTMAFRMEQPIPSYLIAIGAGDLAFRELGPRSGVWAEPSVVEAAAWEFADTEKMIAAVEELYGPYRWERYDILVLPPSFPFGGMENPRLTFATPTILAGDRSLVALIAHELAHSWSGNLVTNATWRDFWLNEGFTVYLEQRIMEKLYGRERAAMEIMLGMKGLREEMAGLEPRDHILHVDLDGRDPDEGFTSVPYDKGAAFLRRLEEVVGRAAFDRFLHRYFDAHAFASITTEQFRRFLDDELIAHHPRVREEVDIENWIEGTGLPDDAPDARSDAFAAIDVAVAAWLEGRTPLAAQDVSDWTTHEWLHFIGALGKTQTTERLAEIDAAFELTASENSEITCAWLELALNSLHEPAYQRAERFLLAQGRRKFLKPLYVALSEHPEHRERARSIYRRARPLYHAISRATIDEILGWSEKDAAP